MIRVIFCFALGIWFRTGSTLEAASISADTIHVGTIGGQLQPDGVTFSSYVYVAAGSSVTLQGAMGFVTTSSSMTGASFWGDASNLSGVVTLGNNQKFSGADAFTSGLTIQSGGRQIILSTSTSVNNLNITSAGVLSFYPELHNSSSTIIPAASTTNSNMGPCVAGSTITITTTGGRVEVTFAGILGNSDTTNGDPAVMGFLQDGSFVNDLSVTKGIVRTTGQPGGGFSAANTGSFRYLLGASSSGSHSYCLTIAAPAGGTTSINVVAGSTTNVFYVKEIK